MKSHLYTSDEEGVETALSSLPGTILDGGYEIKELLRSEPHASVFRVRILGDRYTQAEVMFFGLNEWDASAQIECWRNAKALRSPYFNAPLSFGTRRLAEGTIAYVVVVKADENLAEVIRERPLKAEEASDTMLSVARALVDLHSSGLIHGFVSPEHILSIGQDIKLSGYTSSPIGSNSQPYPYKPAYLAPESSGCNSTPAADVWCLGASLIEALSQKACDDRYAEQLESLPSRFAYIAMRCLETNPSSRATASEALGMLEGRIPLAVPKPAPLAAIAPLASAPLTPAAPLAAAAPLAPAVPLAAAAAAASGAGWVPMVETAPAPETIKKELPASMPAPSTRVSERVKESNIGESELGGFGSEIRPIWVYAGGLVLLALVFWLAWPRHGGSVATKQVAAATQPSPKPFVPQTSVPQTSSVPVHPVAQHSISPHSVSQQSPPAPAIPKTSGASGADTSSGATVGTATSGEQIWRVIAYAYHSRDNAEEMASFINKQHPELAATVFSPHGHSVLYLVTVGSQMTRDEAARYRSQAIKSGMPRDTYIQNYRSE